MLVNLGEIINNLERNPRQQAKRSYTTAIPRLFHQYGGKGKFPFNETIRSGKNPYFNIIEDMGRAIDADTFIDAYAGSATCTFLAMLATKADGKTPLYDKFTINEKDYPIYCLLTITQRKETKWEPDISDLKRALLGLKHSKKNYDIATEVLANYYFAESIKSNELSGADDIYNLYKIIRKSEADAIRDISYDDYLDYKDAIFKNVKSFLSSREVVKSGKSTIDEEMDKFDNFFWAMQKIQNALEKGRSYSDLELAVCTFITHNMSRYGSQKGFAAEKDGDAKLETIFNQIDRVHEFLNRGTVTITNRDAADVISEFTLRDKQAVPRQVLFMDPPYLPTVRAQGAQDIYGSHEMGILDHSVGIFQKLELIGNVGWILCGKVDTDKQNPSTDEITDLIEQTHYKELNKQFIKREDIVGVNTTANSNKENTKKVQAELIWHAP